MSTYTGPTIFGIQPFKLALGVEIIGNLATIPPLLFYPRTVLGWILSNPGRDINPSSEYLTQMIGTLIVALTVPLMVSFPSPNGTNTFRGMAQHRGIRSATYVTLASGEISLAILLGSKLLAASRGQDVGLTDRAMWMGLGTMLSIIPMRAFFLFGNRTFIEDRDDPDLENEVEEKKNL